MIWNNLHDITILSEKAKGRVYFIIGFSKKKKKKPHINIFACLYKDYFQNYSLPGSTNFASAGKQGGWGTRVEDIHYMYILILLDFEPCAVLFSLRQIKEK